MCHYCDLIYEMWEKLITTNYGYWLATEVFVILHDGKDYCEAKT